MMKKFSLFLISFLSTSSAFSQIAVDGTAPNNQAQHLVENVLINANAIGLTVSNVTLSEGVDTQIGYFSNGTADISMSDGIVLSTGGLDLVTGTGQTGTGGPGINEPDLAMQMFLVGMDTNTIDRENVVVIEFDFEAAGDVIEFDYVFASHEYPGYTCSQFNDMFGFFISGPGITGPFSNNGKNIALVPDPDNPSDYTTTPVAINTINSGTPSGANSAPCDDIDADWADYNVFFVDNNPIPAGSINYPGYTTVLTATSEVICGETYHLKLAICDASDNALNSAVFIEAGSFNVVSANTDQTSEYQFSDSVIIEGCYDGVLEFELNSYSDVNPAVFHLGVGGTATEGFDYAEIPDSVIVPPGDSTFTITIAPIVDYLDEGDETVIIYTFACNDTVSAITYVIQDPDPIVLGLSDQDTLICANTPDAISVTANATNGYVPYTYRWYYEGALEFNTATVAIDPEDEGIHIVEVEGDCGYTYTDTFRIVHFPPTATTEYDSPFNLETSSIVEGCEYLVLNVKLPAPAENDTVLQIDIVGGDAVEGTDFYPIPRNLHIAAGDSTASINIEAIVDGEFEEDETIEIFYHFYDECSDGPNPEVITIHSNPLLNVEIDDVMELCKGEDFTLDAEAIGGIEPFVYTWTKADAIWTGDEVDLVAEDSAMFYLTVRDACGYETFDSIFVEVPQYEPLVVSSDLQLDMDICKDDALPLEYAVTGGSGDYTYKWSLDGIPVSYEQEYTVQNMDVSYNEYRLVVTDHCGNSSARDFKVKVEHCEIPNVMTPNGDGNNDYFFIDFRDAAFNIQMHIYDRWGKLVYESFNYENCNLSQAEFCWDGVSQSSGKSCEEGVYFYIMEYPDGKIFKGTFSLIK
jgi:gliding motility-associated-like protein